MNVTTAEAIRTVRRQAEALSKRGFDDAHDVHLAADQLQKALASAPMPFRESTLPEDEWDERYSDWWHEHSQGLEKPQ